jgi:hypothetical protein
LDFVNIEDSDIAKATGAITTINNGPGGSRVTFTTTDPNVGNTVYGALNILNGANPIGVPGLMQLDDFVSFNNTNVWGAVLVNNDVVGGGDTRVAVLDNSMLGSNINTGGPLLVINGAGSDNFQMDSSMAYFGVSIMHGLPGQYFGSTTTINNSEIGTVPIACTPSGGCATIGLTIQGDDGNDNVDITDSTIEGPVVINLLDGLLQSIDLLRNSPLQQLQIVTLGGLDTVTIEGTDTVDQVLVQPIITLGAGNDTLTLDNVTVLGNALISGDDAALVDLALNDVLNELDVLYQGGVVQRINWNNL